MCIQRLWPSTSDVGFFRLWFLAIFLNGGSMSCCCLSHVSAVTLWQIWHQTKFLWIMCTASLLCERDGALIAIFLISLEMYLICISINRLLYFFTKDIYYNLRFYLDQAIVLKKQSCLLATVLLLKYDWIVMRRIWSQLCRLNAVLYVTKHHVCQCKTQIFADVFVLACLCKYITYLCLCTTKPLKYTFDIYMVCVWSLFVYSRLYMH